MWMPGGELTVNLHVQCLQTKHNKVDFFLNSEWSSLWVLPHNLEFPQPDCELAHIGHVAVQGEDKDDGTHGFQGGRLTYELYYK